MMCVCLCVEEVKEEMKEEVRKDDRQTYISGLFEELQIISKPPHTLTTNGY